MYALITFHTPVYAAGELQDVVAVEAGTTTNVPESTDPADIFLIASPKMWIMLDNIAGIYWSETVPEGIPVV